MLKMWEQCHVQFSGSDLKNLGFRAKKSLNKIIFVQVLSIEPHQAFKKIEPR